MSELMDEDGVPAVLRLPAPNRFVCSDFSLLDGCSAATLPLLVRSRVTPHE